MALLIHGTQKEISDDIIFIFFGVVATHLEHINELYSKIIMHKLCYGYAFYKLIYKMLHCYLYRTEILLCEEIYSALGFNQISDYSFFLMFLLMLYIEILV